MLLRRLVISIVFLVTVSLLFHSCGIGLLVRGVAVKKFTKEDNVIPEDFIDKNATLLVMQWESGYDKFARKAFDKYYLGKKEYVTFNELAKDEKYSDLNKYPYAFSQGPGAKKIYSGEGYSYTYSGSRPFHIYDRKTKKFYMSNFRSGFYYRIIQAYAKQMEFYRTENRIGIN